MMRALLACLSIVVSTAATRAEVMKMAVTTSFENSGLAEILLPAIKEDLDIEVRLLVVGTGQAIKMGETGDVDALLVHARSAEEAFVDAGFGTHRHEIMYNDFVLIGPATDPAATAAATGAAAALQAIAAAETPFVSRGDDSGTHKAELAVWAAAGLSPAGFGPWYKSVGAGMGAALNTAAGLDAYILADRASWLNFGNKGGLVLLFSGDPVLFNQYAFLPVSPARHPHVRNDLAMKLELWLVGERAKALINGYKIADTPLFVFNATP